MADKRFEIDVRVTGDASGAKNVSQGLDDIAKAANQAGGTNGVGGLGSKMQALFPTFTKLGGSLKSMTGAWLASVNPMTLAATAATAAAAALVKAYMDAKRGEEEFLAIAGESWKKQKLAVDEFLPSQSALATALKNSGDAISAITEKLTANEAAIATAIGNEAKLAASAEKLALARIALAESEGRISEAEANRQRAVVEATSAEEAFANQVAASNAILEQRRLALEAVNAEVQKLKAAQAAAEQGAAQAGEGSVRAQAARIDPELNLNLDQSRRELQAALSESDTSLGDQINEFVENVKALTDPNQFSLSFALGGLAGVFLETRDEVNARVEAAQAAAKQSQEEFDAALKARTEAINKAAETSRQTIDALNARIEAETAKLEQVKQSVIQAEAAAAANAPGGINSQIFTNEQTAAVVAGAADGTNPILTPEAVAGAAPSQALTQLLGIVADGIQKREAQTAEALVQMLQLQNTGNAALLERLKRAEEQIAALRNG